MLISSRALALHFYPGRQACRQNRCLPLYKRLLKKLRLLFS